ncbi:MscL family protein [Streptomyces phaeoluteigriseus]|uniref:MscL family protein n=1 Tax=Streptomyces phaeoluteigriseus TaxID=114686 RepID=UPI001FEB300E|nr:MscL family protein [Streptomyces phaeoluteigriseus]
MRVQQVWVRRGQGIRGEAGRADCAPGAARRRHGLLRGEKVKGFRSFILRGNVVDLAVGIVIGAAFDDVNRRGHREVRPARF